MATAPAPAPTYAPFPGFGEPVDWFTAPIIGGRPDWAFASIGGRVCLMLFYGSASAPGAEAALAAIRANRAVFDDVDAVFFGVSIDPRDVASGQVDEDLPGLRHFADAGREISRRFGAAPNEDGDVIQYRPHFVLLDGDLRVVARFPLERAEQAIAAARAEVARARQDWAPVLSVSNVFEPELCAKLIDYYEARGGEPSGFMRQIDGKTKLVVDSSFKKRADCPIEDRDLARALQVRLERRLVPMMRRAFQFQATRIERYIVARYDADEGGFFRAHRDNTTKGTAHRRFACTINLNADYDGGDLRFPEFGNRAYRAPVGGAVLFSCSLLHEATPVTRGTRYAFLPFFYDEEGAALRERNNEFLSDEVGRYKAGGTGAT